MPRPLLYLAALLPMVFPLRGEDPLPLSNPGFEEQENGWIFLEKDLPQPMSRIAAEAAREGSAGLLVEDQDATRGSSVASQPLPAEAGKTYRLSFFARSSQGRKGAVYLRFHDAKRNVIDSSNLPTAVVEKGGDQWEPYAVEARAPAGTASISIWIHTWSGAKGMVSFDDFKLEQLSGPDSAGASVPAAEKSVRLHPPAIIIKADDLKLSGGGRLSPAWERFFEILQRRGIKGSIGIIAQSLEGDNPAYVEWIRKVQTSGLVEFWFHGYTHEIRRAEGKARSEFNGLPYEEQLKRFQQSEKLAGEKLGLTFTTFGPPGGGEGGHFDAVTIRVMGELPSIKVWLYPTPLDEAGRALAREGKVVILDRVWPVNIEQPLFQPNAEKFREGYARYPDREYFVIQGHPASWNEAEFAEFEKILDFLQKENAVFVTPAAFASSLGNGAAQTVSNQP